MRYAAAVAALTLLGLAPSPVASVTGLNGDALLLRSAKLNPAPLSYSVPLHFVARLHRPISVRFRASAMTYFKAPDKQSLVITSLPKLIRRHINSYYSDLDTIPQVWPAKYRVFSAIRTQVAGAATYHLDATPKTAGSITHVTFDLLVNGLSPVGAEWYFQDGSTVRLSIVNQRIGRYVLPQREDISIAMRGFSVDASCDPGTYAINAPIADAVFAK